MKSNLSLTWDLESIFPGGSSSQELNDFLSKLEKDIAAVQQIIQDAIAPVDIQATKVFDGFIASYASCVERVSEASSFVSCLGAQDQHDKKAIQLSGKVTNLQAQLMSVSAEFEHLLRNTEDEVWDQWMEREELVELSFVLNESREQAREKLNPELESLALDLAVDGYHGWGGFYDTIVSHVQIPFDEDGTTKMLSAGQAANKLHDPRLDIRESMFDKWEEAWTKSEDYCADTLNHLAGFRLKLYDRRGWNSILQEPLSINRMSQQTLNAMWNVIIDNKSVFVEYLERKAKILGVEKLSWVDVEAPIGNISGKITYQEAAEDIVKQFRKFSPKLAEFSELAFDQGWIEAEDRPGKRPGGFCTALSVSKETRIFMTFGGTASNVSTLAHELGHGYHQHLMNDLHVLNQNYAMNVAETASTFAEMIVADALVKAATDPQEKLALLEEKIQNSIAFFMNIHARFLFETRFYDLRKNGLVSAQELSTLMEEAQQEAFCGALSSYHPHFWAAKLHFYITDVPFYNFPYTFGYMFSTGLYVRAQQEGASFADKYDLLLQDTGMMTVEELASKHLAVDLTGPEFWQSAIDLCISDVKEFMEMTEHLA
ncbi:M3 family oligoendopeptidase [Paenibacillus crassostreae]|uniref:Oligoendopeptidase n=1 Tax=Paenibacillus crassostreae TaxID=1763538 RepID=A0A167CT82_9BACL|nr:M3 family oligoendopeptidase [Paenibacillus crassostreae]AOZ93533.1 oligoendopeptidase [Paenibacillus crassostreae]OAB73554.1 oligoendopeptidase [Paenibacillus crassostreae]